MKIKNIIAKSDLDYYKQHINFTREEEIVFDMLSKGKSIKEIADKLNTSETTVSRRIKSVKDKIGGLMDMRSDVPVCDKLNLTVEEAAAYSNIGINKINRMLDEPSCSFILQVGKGKRLVKRKEFEKYLLKTSDITDI